MFLVKVSLLLPDDAVVVPLLEDHLTVLGEVATDDEHLLAALDAAPVHRCLAHLWLARRLCCGQQLESCVYMYTAYIVWELDIFVKKELWIQLTRQSRQYEYLYFKKIQTNVKIKHEQNIHTHRVEKDHSLNLK